MLDCLLIILDYILTPWVIAPLISAIFLIGVTYWNSRVVRNRETITLMQKIAWDTEYINARDLFIDVRGKGIEYCIKTPQNPKYKAIMRIMNHYEILAISVDRNILSEKVLKRFIGKRLVADWHASKAFVMALRKKNNDDESYIFCEFENLAKKWEKEQ